MAKSSNAFAASSWGFFNHHNRTSNALERVNLELKRRTRVAGMFPNEASVLRLVTALLVEISDQWQTGKTYLNMKSLTPPIT